MQKTQFTLRQYIGKDNIAKLFGQDKANDESFINRKVIFIDEQTKNFVGSDGGNKRFEFQVEGTFHGFALKCGITPENKDILYGPDIPMLKREQRNVKEMGAFEYRYSRGNKKIDTSWVDKLCSKYGIEDHMVAAFGGDEDLYKTLTKYYCDIKDPRILKALHENYDVGYIIETFMPDDFKKAVDKLNVPEHVKNMYLSKYMEENFLAGKQAWQESVDMSTAYNDEPNKGQIYLVKRLYMAQIDFDTAQMEQVVFATEDPAIALKYVQMYNNQKSETNEFFENSEGDRLTVDIVSLVHNMDEINRSPNSFTHSEENDYYDDYSL